jgi:hypothetical protein
MTATDDGGVAVLIDDVQLRYAADGSLRSRS